MGPFPIEHRAPRRSILASLRKLLMRLSRSSDQLEALCIDHFPPVAREFSDGMTTTARINLLLTKIEPGPILAQLRRLRAFARDADQLLTLVQADATLADEANGAEARARDAV